VSSPRQEYEIAAPVFSRKKNRKDSYSNKSSLTRYEAQVGSPNKEIITFKYTEEYLVGQNKMFLIRELLQFQTELYHLEKTVALQESHLA
jgi:hypothetical protein